MKIKYTVGDATDPIGDGIKMIVHCCNNQGGWGAGFVVALSKRWPHVEHAYRHWHTQTFSRDALQREKDRERVERSGALYGMTGRFELGQVQWVQADKKNKTIVTNLIGQHRTGMLNIAGVTLPPVDYRSIREGFARVKEYYLKGGGEFSLHLPRLGCGLAGGKWSEIEKILNEVFGDTDIEIVVYDFAPGAVTVEDSAVCTGSNDNQLVLSRGFRGEFAEKVVYKGGLFELQREAPSEFAFDRGYYELTADFTGDRSCV